MKRLGKILGWVFAALAVVLAAGITFTIGWRPFIGPRARALTARKFESTPARLARGEYLVPDANDCMDCHAGRESARPRRGAGRGAGTSSGTLMTAWIATPGTIGRRTMHPFCRTRSAPA